MTTIETLTDEQIDALANEAATAGDDAQHLICVMAANGNEDARAECVRVIRDAEAQDWRNDPDEVASAAADYEYDRRKDDELTGDR